MPCTVRVGAICLRSPTASGIFYRVDWTVSLQALPQYTFNSIAVPIKMFEKAARRGLDEGGGVGQVQQKKRVNIYAQHENTCCAHSTLLAEVKVLYRSIMCCPYSHHTDELRAKFLLSHKPGKHLNPSHS